MKIELTAEQAQAVVGYLQGLSDRLAKEHELAYSGVDKLVLISAIQEIDRLAVEIREQVEMANA